MACLPQSWDQLKNRRDKKEEEKKEENRKKQKKEEKQKKKPKRKRIMKAKRVVEEWEIWNEEEEAVKLEKEAKKLVPPRFYKWIHIFRKKASERIPMKKKV